MTWQTISIVAVLVLVLGACESRGALSSLSAQQPAPSPTSGPPGGQSGAAGVGGIGGVRGAGAVGGGAGGAEGVTTAGLTVLASGQPSPYTLAIDDSSVYWANWGAKAPTDVSVAKVALNGGPVTTLVAGVAGASGIALDRMHVYFVGAGTNGYGLLSVPLAGGSPTFMAAGFTNDPIAVGPAGVYGSGSLDSRTTTVLSAPLGGGSAVAVVPPSALQQTFATYGIAVAGNTVYWVTFSDPALVMAAPLAGGAPTTLAKAPGAGGGLAVDADAIYFATGKAVMKVARAGGTPTTLASLTGTGVAIDDQFVYFTDFYGSNSTVTKVPKAGGAPITLATGQERPDGIAVDDTSVYWTNGGSESGATGTIMKLTPK
jgi:hypothetical protein